MESNNLLIESLKTNRQIFLVIILSFLKLVTPIKWDA